MGLHMVEIHAKRRDLALYVAGGFLVPYLVTRAIDWHHPAWDVLVSGAVACYLVFEARHLVALYKARRRPYPH